MSVLATDDFNRANETPLAGNWTTVTSETNSNLSSNTVVPSVLSNDSTVYRNDITPPNDQYSQAKITVNNNSGGGIGQGVAVRVATGARTYYRVVADHAASNNVELGAMVAGTFTPIWTRTQAFTDGDTFRLEVQGTTLRVYRNGVQIGADSTDSNIASGRFGLSYSSTATSASADDWEGGDFAGAVSSGPRIARATLRPNAFAPGLAR